jgi:ankyrin repeat protein
VDVLLAKAGNDAVKVRDANGDLPLHLAAQQGHPMCAYNIANVGTTAGVLAYSYSTWWLAWHSAMRGIV